MAIHKSRAVSPVVACVSFVINTEQYKDEGQMNETKNLNMTSVVYMTWLLKLVSLQTQPLPLDPFFAL